MYESEEEEKQIVKKPNKKELPKKPTEHDVKELYRTDDKKDCMGLVNKIKSGLGNLKDEIE